MTNWKRNVGSGRVLFLDSPACVTNHIKPQDVHSWISGRHLNQETFYWQQTISYFFNEEHSKWLIFSAGRLFDSRLDDQQSRMWGSIFTSVSQGECHDIHYYFLSSAFISLNFGVTELNKALMNAHEKTEIIYYDRTAFYPQKHFWYSFLLEAESTPGS
jgi:hypothetical protein